MACLQCDNSDQMGHAIGDVQSTKRAAICMFLFCRFPSILLQTFPYADARQAIETRRRHGSPTTTDDGRDRNDRPHDFTSEVCLEWCLLCNSYISFQSTDSNSYVDCKRPRIATKCSSMDSALVIDSKHDQQSSVHQQRSAIADDNQCGSPLECKPRLIQSLLIATTNGTDATRNEPSISRRMSSSHHRSSSGHRHHRV